MESVEFGRWHVRHDPEATRLAYSILSTGSAEVCGCIYCRNFIAARTQAFPPDALALFSRLGVNPAREAEVYQFAELDSGLHLYGGFFHLVGSLAAGEDAVGPDGEVHRHPISSGCSVGFTKQVALVRPPFPPSAVLQLEFLTEVPWLLEEAP